MARNGRNEPCPCGSGKKRKRCCGSGEVTETELARAVLHSLVERWPERWKNLPLDRAKAVHYLERALEIPRLGKDDRRTILQRLEAVKTA